MKRKWTIVPKYIHGLLGAVLVVMIVQYALLTGLVKPVHLVFEIMQAFCYLLLAVAVFRGFIQRSRLAWLVSQIMLSAMFCFSVLFSMISAVFALKAQGLWVMLGAGLATAILNGVLLGFLFSLPVCDYFSPFDENQ